MLPKWLVARSLGKGAWADHSSGMRLFEGIFTQKQIHPDGNLQSENVDETDYRISIVGGVSFTGAELWGCS